MGYAAHSLLNALLALDFGEQHSRYHIRRLCFTPLTEDNRINHMRLSSHAT